MIRNTQLEDHKYLHSIFYQTRSTFEGSTECRDPIRKPDGWLVWGGCGFLLAPFIVSIVLNITTGIGYTVRRSPRFTMRFGFLLNDQNCCFWHLWLQKWTEWGAQCYQIVRLDPYSTLNHCDNSKFPKMRILWWRPHQRLEMAAPECESFKCISSDWQHM